MELTDLPKNCKYCFKIKDWAGSHNPRAYFIGDDLWYFSTYSTNGLNLTKKSHPVLKSDDWVITDIPNPEYKNEIDIKAIYEKEF